MQLLHSLVYQKFPVISNLIAENNPGYKLEYYFTAFAMISCRNAPVVLSYVSLCVENR